MAAQMWEWNRTVWIISLLSAVMLTASCSKQEAATNESTKSVDSAAAHKRTPTVQEVNTFVKDCSGGGVMTEAACRCAAEQILVNHSQEEMNRAQTGSSYRKKKAIFAYLRQIRPIIQTCDTKFPPVGGSRLASAIAAQDEEEKVFFENEIAPFPMLADDLCRRTFSAASPLCESKVTHCAVMKARAQHSDVAVADFFDTLSNTDEFKVFFEGFLQQCAAEKPPQVLVPADAFSSTSEPSADQQLYQSDLPENDNQPNG